MKRQPRTSDVLPLLGLILCAGCAVQNPFASTTTSFENSVSALAESQTNQTQNAPRAEALANQTEIRPDPQPAWSNTQDETLGNRFLTSLGRAGGSVSRALSWQPKRLPPDDPVRLSTEPPTPGPDLHYKAGRVFESQQDTARAINHYELALEMQPQDIKSLVALARVCDRAGDLRRAETLYQQAAAQHPQDSAILNDLGICYAKQGKTEGAIATLQLAVQQSPSSKRYRNNIATVLLNAGRKDEALQQMAAVHGQAVAHYNVGYMLSKRGEHRLARQHLMLALQVDPRLDLARQLLAQLGGGVPTHTFSQSTATQSMGLPAESVGYPQPAAGTSVFRSLPPL